MDPADIRNAVQPSELRAAVDADRAALEALHGMHMGANTSVREVLYAGHLIRIATTYEIEVDGVAVTGHLLVSNAGTVHYHAIPNQEFASAVDLVKRVIDLDPDAFGQAAKPAQHDHGAGDMHEHGDPGHGHPEHGGM